jgi:hypothetical protein
METLRLCARIVATPIFALAFGFTWLGWMIFLGPMFQLFSFLSKDDDFSWREWLNECNEFFCEPFAEMWVVVQFEFPASCFSSKNQP